MIEFIKENLQYIVPALFSLFTGMYAFISGLKSRKVKKKLTENEQREDMRKKMVEEVNSIQKFSGFLRNSMQKNNLAEYKSSTVLKNMKMYADACGYSWYNENEWKDVLTGYIADTKSAQK